VPGLTEFLVNQHYKRIGVLSKSENTLFDFWKKYVSAAYKQRREDKIKSKLNITGYEQHHTTMNLGTSFKTQKSQKENMGVLDDTKEKSVLGQYKKYENIYEMDVRYTI
jgi:hypothetical protein